MELIIETPDPQSNSDETIRLTVFGVSDFQINANTETVTLWFPYSAPFDEIEVPGRIIAGIDHEAMDGETMIEIMLDGLDKGELIVVESNETPRLTYNLKQARDSGAITTDRESNLTTFTPEDTDATFPYQLS